MSIYAGMFKRPILTVNKATELWLKIEAHNGKFREAMEKEELIEWVSEQVRLRHKYAQEFGL